MSEEISENLNTENMQTTAASTMKLGFIDTLFGTLCAPVQTFRHLALCCKQDSSQLPAAFAVVILVFALDALRLTPANQISWALFNVPSEVSGGIMLWLLSAGVVSLTSLCFGQDTGKVRASFVTLAWSLLPWLFTGPIACFWKILGPAHVLFMTVPLLWIVFLQIVAIKESFEMKTWQSIVLVLLIPPLLSWYQLMQFLQALAATLGSLM